MSLKEQQHLGPFQTPHFPPHQETHTRKAKQVTDSTRKGRKDFGLDVMRGNLEQTSAAACRVPQRASKGLLLTEVSKQTARVTGAPPSRLVRTHLLKAVSASTRHSLCEAGPLSRPQASVLPQLPAAQPASGRPISPPGEPWALHQRPPVAWLSPSRPKQNRWKEGALVREEDLLTPGPCRPPALPCLLSSDRPFPALRAAACACRRKRPPLPALHRLTA